MSWSRRGTATMQCREFFECFFLYVRSAKSATAKFIATGRLIEIIHFTDFAIFYIYLLQIYFEPKCSK